MRLGLELGAPFDLTWSCYSREDSACGVCDSCVLRLRAFRERAARTRFRYVADGGKSLVAPARMPAPRYHISFMSREAKNMKQRLLMLMLVVMVTALCVPPVFAQATGTVKGVCKDMEGKPIVDANLEWLNTDNGRKYT